MLLAIREKVTGWIAYGIIFLISIPFALWGVNSYFGGGELAPAAVVNGEEISARVLDQEYANYRQRLSQLFGGSIPESFGSEEMLRMQVLDQLVERSALRQYIAEQRYRIGDAELNRLIRGMEAFQTDGRFDTAIYEAQLRSLGYSTLGFEQELRVNGAVDQFQAGIQATSFLSPSERKRYAELTNQTRKLRTIRFSVDAASIEVSDDEIEQRYQTKSDRYRSPQQVKIDYIDVNLEGIKQGIEINSDDLLARYQDNQNAYTTPETREASHILITVKDDADSDAALEKIQGIRARIVAGEDFAELAREFSEDPGSAGDGGSLGEIERGVMVQTFEAELFSMQVDELSEPVKTGFGWHLIKLHAVSGGEVRSFESVREELEDEIRTELAESQIYDLVENLSNLAYEQPDSLLPAAEQLDLTVQTSDWFSRASGTGVAAEPAVRQRAFTPEILTEGLNSEGIELSEERIVFIRLNQLKPAAELPLEQVRDRIEGELKAEKLRERNQADGSAALEALNAGKTLDQLAADLALEVSDLGFIERNQADVDGTIRSRAFSMAKPEEGAVYDGFSVGGGEYVIVELSAVLSSDAPLDAEVLERITNNQGGADYQSAVKMLTSQAEVVKTPIEELSDLASGY